MKILITGAKGFIGSSLVDYYQNKMEVIHYYRGYDINDIANIRPEYIIHCAAEIYDKEKMFESNVILTYQMLEAAKKVSNLKHFIYIGSSSEYGRKSNPMKESDVLEPDSIYEGTKACGSMLTRAYGKTYGIQTSIVRPFSVYGPKEPPHRFLPKLYNEFKNDGDIKIADGVHDFIHIYDFVKGIDTVLNGSTPSGEVFHFGTGVQLTNLEVYETFSRLFGKHIRHTLSSNTGGKSAGIDSDSWVADITKVKEVFGWEPEYTFEQGLSQYINYRNTNG